MNAERRFREILQGSGEISRSDLQVCLDIVGSLEERENKLVESFNSVLENLYLLPGSILGICTGVSGMFYSDSKIRMLFIVVVVLALAFCLALSLPLRFAYRQLSRLKQKGAELANERNDLHRNFDRLKPRIRDDKNLDIKKLRDFENQNKELKFVMLWYVRCLWLIATCGVVYTLVFVIAGFHVFWRRSGTCLMHILSKNLRINY